MVLYEPPSESHQRLLYRNILFRLQVLYQECSLGSPCISTTLISSYFLPRHTFSVLLLHFSPNPLIFSQTRASLSSFFVSSLLVKGGHLMNGCTWRAIIVFDYPIHYPGCPNRPPRNGEPPARWSVVNYAHECRVFTFVDVFCVDLVSSLRSLVAYFILDSWK